MAVKVLKVKDIKKQFKHLYNEILTLRNTDHPNIIKLIEIFHESKFDENGKFKKLNKIYLVMEYFHGQNLFEYLMKKSTLREDKVAMIVSQILRALKYLHKNKICHRDLKMENIMIDPLSKFVKIIDFEFSRKFKEYELRSQIGTPYYLAPEVIKGSYSYQCDLWSLGVLTC